MRRKTSKVFSLSLFYMLIEILPELCFSVQRMTTLADEDVGHTNSARQFYGVKIQRPKPVLRRSPRSLKTIHVSLRPPTTVPLIFDFQIQYCSFFSLLEPTRLTARSEDPTSRSHTSILRFLSFIPQWHEDSKKTFTSETTTSDQKGLTTDQHHRALKKKTTKNE